MARVIIVSNRLPVSVKKQDGKLVFSQSTGGVATGLASYANNPNNRWIGWPGIPSDELKPAEKREISRELARHNCIPVFLTKQQIDTFYNGYSNSILWPLFHNLPVQGKRHREQWWEGYQDVNKLFSNAALKVAQRNSRIWVHDYQLLLVPELLRAANPQANIGFFLHIPFPRPRVFAKLPEANNLITGMLGARLVGFHTTGYANNFLDTSEELDIGTAGRGQVVLGNRIIRITDFPMGIDYEKYAQSNQSATVRTAVLKYKLRYRGQKIIVAVDRLDPSKGLVERLEAYREFLQNNYKKMRGKVVFSMVVAPSRTEVAAYKKLQAKLDVLVTEINAEFGTRRWQPIDYINESLPFEEVSALLQVADIAFIAPIRDGMNLVAKEYVASRRGGGVLILSETAGAAQELTDALLVNPAHPSTVVEALEKSFNMPRRELKKRFSAMQEQLSTNTVHHWASNFMKTLQQPVPGAQALRTPSLTSARLAKVATNYQVSSKRLLLLDYDGTLVPHANHHAHATPPKKLIRLLEKLSSDPKNEVVLISGRSSQDLQEWFGDTNINLIAEHGALIKSAGHKTWRETVTSGRRWKRTILPILQHYNDLTPDATIEEKQYSLVWHYRQSPAFASQKNLQILQRVLRPLSQQFGIDLFHGSKILEIKDPHITKGHAVRRWLRREHDFVLVVGDDFTDEDMFAAVPASATTIKVGRGRTIANYRVAGHEEVITLLQTLA
ncbi:MAG TPA: bifunctional alpha,alpha-trehalose-phosphate synthase (UDP-forming)/trehalose-phosphatase [Candidatus Saccharimonadales bacterium]